MERQKGWLLFHPILDGEGCGQAVCKKERRAFSRCRFHPIFSAAALRRFSGRLWGGWPPVLRPPRGACEKLDCSTCYPNRPRSADGEFASRGLLGGLYWAGKNLLSSSFHHGLPRRLRGLCDPPKRPIQVRHTWPGVRRAAFGLPLNAKECSLPSSIPRRTPSSAKT